MKRKRIIKLIALLILVLTLLFSLTACYEYPVNSVGDFFNLIAYIFVSVLVKIFLVPIWELSDFIKNLFSGSLSFGTTIIQFIQYFI